MTDLPLAGAAPGDRLTGRRVLFGALVVLTMAGLLSLASATLAAGGFDGIDLALLVLLALTLPWTTIGFWNAAIGFLIMRLSRDPVAVVFPVAGRVRDDEAIQVSVAILVCIRNETPARVVGNLSPTLEGLQRAGVAAQFHAYILSDTTDATIAAEEEATFAALAQSWRGRIAVTYRRRTDNIGFKAGNIRDFCQHYGARHDIAITLDADSVMPAEAMLRLARLMQAEPRLGIVQGLVIGLPATSAFTRIFQFGMRLGMRSYTIGSAWWQGDCGPYWGHNAALRLAPFIQHCQLPELPGGGHVLSHDQLEAVLMRRAGYEVRVLPEENLGWEENPPTLVEFIRRDLRWCQGNMQYWRFLMMPGLKFVSRCQLALAIVMFMGSPAWIGLLLLGTIAAALAPDTFVDPFYGRWLLGLYLLMWFAPKIATVTDVLLRRPMREAYGGSLRLLASVASEVVFFLLLSPIQWLSHTLLIIGLPFGLSVGWGAQARHEHSVTFLRALWRFWPQTLLGLASLSVLAVRNPSAIPVALLIAGGLALAVPLAIISALPFIGRVMTRIGLGRLPEETAPPDVLRGLPLPALAQRGDA